MDLPTPRTGLSIVAGLVLATAGLVVITHDDGKSAPDPPASDTQLVSYHGVEMTVPASWKLNDTHFGEAMSDTVVLGSAVREFCLLNNPPRVTMVELVEMLEPTAPPDGYSPPAEPERASAVEHDGRFREVQTFPDVRIRVTVVSPDRALARALLATAHEVDVTSAGCATVGSLATADALPGSAQQLVPGEPARGRICQYGNGWIKRSAALIGAELDQLVEILNGLPEGFTRPRTGYLNSICPGVRTHGFRLEFDYPDDRVGAVIVRIADCEQLSATNGVRTTKIYGELTKFLLDRVGYDDGFDPASGDKQPTVEGARDLCSRGLPGKEIASATPALVGDLREHRIGPGSQPAKDGWPGVNRAATGAWCWTLDGPKAYGAYAVGPDATYVKFADVRGFDDTPSGPPTLP